MAHIVPFMRNDCSVVWELRGDVEPALCELTPECDDDYGVDFVTPSPITVRRLRHQAMPETVCDKKGAVVL